MRNGKWIAVAVCSVCLVRGALPDGCASDCVSAPMPSQSARDLLSLALANKPLRNLTARISMTVPGGFKEHARVTFNTEGEERIEYFTKEGNIGVVIVDDLDTRTVYDPFARTLTVGKSPRKPFDISARVAHITANYRLSRVGVRLAHRDIAKITAVPYWNDLSTIRLYVDPKSGYILERTSTEPSGDTFTQYRTTELNYLDSVDPSTFTVTADGDVTTRQEHPPRFVSSIDAAKKSLSFTPIRPSKLPNGFRIDRMFLIGQRHFHGIGFMVSNGLATATLFQFSKKSPPRWLKDGGDHHGDSVTRGDVIISVMTSESKTVRKRLLASIQ